MTRPVPRSSRSARTPLLTATLVATLGLGASAVLPAPADALQDADEGTPTVSEATEEMEPMEGYFDLWWDEAEGRLLLEIDRWEEEFLYQVSLATGLGSNPVGLDRGQLGDTRVVEARRVGPRVLLVQPNYGYRARTDDDAEVRAVREAFAPSTVWAFEVEAETGDRVLVDATDFFLRDAHGVVRRLDESGQGTFERDADRSVIHLPGTGAFPRNTEVEASLTFTSDDPGPLVRGTAADGRAVTLRQHHSLVELPDDGYRPRDVDPRVGAFGISFHDYARPLDRELEVRWATRHRLRKDDPRASSSEAREPLVFHVDPGIPEPVRSAVIEGASWWEEAFEAAGFEDAYRVEVLPEDAHPLDLRYNVIHWTHRRTRGWSYGSSVVDPRTGEILKANVNLGSLRLRQDHLLGRGLAPPYGSGPAPAARGVDRPDRPRARGAAAGPAGGQRAARARSRPATGHPLAGAGGACNLGGGPAFGYLAAAADGTGPTDLALARVRQLSAHEVGHTLGLAHNFAASTYGRASVMDYPAPLVRFDDDGGLDLSDAYDTGVGAYDVFAIRWLYGEFPPNTDEAAALDSVVREGLDDGMLYLTDADARPDGAAHPLAGLWDNFSDPVEALRHEIRVRDRGLEAFGPAAVREGRPVAELEEVLVPLYLHHRYQAEATAHTLGGVDYRHALRGDGQTPVRPVDGGRQRQALEALLATLEPGFLALPERLAGLLPPPAPGTAEGERFDGHTAPAFDELAPAAAAARFTLRFLLQPERMARLANQGARSAGAGGDAPPGLDEVLSRLLDATWRSEGPDDGRLAAVDREVESAVLDRLLEEAGAPGNPPRVRTVLEAAVDELGTWLAGRDAPSAHESRALETIRRWQDRGLEATDPSRAPELPPGSPIGGGR